MPPPAPPQPRRITHCPSCGYALHGLPDESTCPECGQTYDQSAYILYAEARGQHATLETSNAPRAMLQGVATLIILLIIFPQLLRPHRLHLIDYAIYGGFFLAIASIVIKRLTADRPGLVQIWLTPNGCAQKNDLAPDSFINALMRYAPFIIWLAILVWGIQYPEKRPTVIYVSIGIIIATLLNRQYTGRFLWTAPPIGPPRLTRWSDIATVSLTPEGTDRYRVRVTPTRSFWRLRTAIEPIDAAITCTPDQAQRLASDAQQWVHDAHTHTAPAGDQ